MDIYHNEARIDRNIKLGNCTMKIKNSHHPSPSSNDRKIGNEIIAKFFISRRKANIMTLIAGINCCIKSDRLM